MGSAGRCGGLVLGVHGLLGGTQVFYCRFSAPDLSSLWTVNRNPAQTPSLVQGHTSSSPALHQSLHKSAYHNCHYSELRFQALDLSCFWSSQTQNIIFLFLKL